MIEEYERLFLQRLKVKGSIDRQNIKIDGIPDENVEAVYAGLYDNKYVRGNKSIIEITPLGENYLLRLPEQKPILQLSRDEKKPIKKTAIGEMWMLISNNQLISGLIGGTILIIVSFYLTRWLSCL